MDEGYEFQPRRVQVVFFDVADISNWRGLFTASAPDEIEENPDADEYQFNGVWDVYSFQKTEGEHTVNVQIIASSKSPFETILNFHSSERQLLTALMYTSSILILFQRSYKTSFRIAMPTPYTRKLPRSFIDKVSA